MVSFMLVLLFQCRKRRLSIHRSDGEANLAKTTRHMCVAAYVSYLLDMSDRTDEVVIIYDGECPFCTGFARLVRLRENVGTVRIVNARDGGPEVERVLAAGLDLDEGNAVLEGGRIHHGTEAQLWLAAHSARWAPAGWFLGTLFATPTLARRSYPIVKGIRNLTLRVTGRKQIGRQPSVL